VVRNLAARVAAGDDRADALVGVSMQRGERIRGGASLRKRSTRKVKSELLGLPSNGVLLGDFNAAVGDWELPEFGSPACSGHADGIFLREGWGNATWLTVTRAHESLASPLPCGSWCHLAPSRLTKSADK
jgi:hypothetical protein